MDNVINENITSDIIEKCLYDIISNIKINCIFEYDNLNLIDINNLNKACICDKCSENYKNILDIESIQNNEIVMQKIIDKYFNELRNI